ncbi:serine/threonine-protein kinase ATM-like isoform X2 [Lolium rigidum]|nr:serine/threonine-protein kinase ATM-like isoform X2 [Lolium rigidum]XP_047067679.1 serine/threonine-protein kinase ATM-like isoform X2 [Lolium rigidum]XP_047067681.1 serine/threonine-protein kinase ATM-like isoform X2 [Lolium rigidum]XP_047067682.1 serine/threonine-protein kinase ATM-like isoform X2 [Lolium rigidum]
MISAVAAIEPSQRELAYALFDSISRKLSYASRTKYLDQLIGPILFRWVACEVSLVSLLEVQEMFGFNSAKPKNFIEHICSWLLLFLILRGDAADLNWISKVLLQPLSAVIKGYFVPIFGLSIAARCGTGPEKDLAETVLYESVLQFGEISELERDDLIRKHMLCGSYGLQQKGDEHLARRSSSRRRRSAPGRGAGGDHPPVCSWARTCLHRRISVLQ